MSKKIGTPEDYARLATEMENHDQQRRQRKIKVIERRLVKVEKQNNDALAEFQAEMFLENFLILFTRGLLEKIAAKKEPLPVEYGADFSGYYLRKVGEWIHIYTYGDHPGEPCCHERSTIPLWLMRVFKKLEESGWQCRFKQEVENEVSECLNTTTYLYVHDPRPFKKKIK